MNIFELSFGTVVHKLIHATKFPSLIYSFKNYSQGSIDFSINYIER